MRRNLMVVAMVAALALGGVACSDDDGGGGDTANALADLMVADSAGTDEEMSKDDALCLADLFVDLLGEDTVKEAIAAGEEGGEAIIDAAMEDIDPDKMMEALPKIMECSPEAIG